MHVVVREYTPEGLKAREAVSSSLSSHTLLPASFAPGIDTGDANMNQCASVLRLLYVDELRRLQTQINMLTSTMQSYTAHPTAGAIFIL